MKVFHRLVAADWVDNIINENTSNPTVRWVRHGRDLTSNGEYRMAMFSKLYRELLKGGPITQKEIMEIVHRGLDAAVRNNWKELQ
ncbi:MAG: hypothetical protein AB1705_01305 [Verrucomicrobiota bacterium]